MSILILKLPGNIIYKERQNLVSYPVTLETWETRSTRKASRPLSRKKIKQIKPLLLQINIVIMLLTRKRGAELMLILLTLHLGDII